MYTYLCFICICLNIGKSVQQVEKQYVGFKGISVKGDFDGLRNFRNSFDGVEGVIFLEQLNEEDNYLVSSGLVDTFQEAVQLNHLEKEVVYNNFSEIIQSEIKNAKNRGQEFSWDAYYDVDAIYAYLKSMEYKYPDQSKLIVGGKSYQGRDILGLRIISPYQEDEGKPAVFIESGIHAREWITPATTTYFINELLTSKDPQIQHLRDSYDWHIFPTVNPDGYHYSHTVDRFWRKTRSQSGNGCFGADPNRNWEHNWNEFGSSSNPCDYQTYSGKAAFSEIETRTLSEYIGGIQNLMAYIGIHADAQMLLLPYSDSKDHFDNYDDLVNTCGDPRAGAFLAERISIEIQRGNAASVLGTMPLGNTLEEVKIGKTSLAYGEKVNGEKYDGPATAAEILYKVSGGSMDWVREALGTPLVYTYELRGRYFHWPAERIPEQGDELTQMLLGLITKSEGMDYFKVGRNHVKIN